MPEEMKLIIMLCLMDAPVWANWVAVDADGEVDVFEHEPHTSTINNFWLSFKGQGITIYHLQRIVPEWKDTLIDIKEIMKNA